VGSFFPLSQMGGLVAKVSLGEKSEENRFENSKKWRCGEV